MNVRSLGVAASCLVALGVASSATAAGTFVDISSGVNSNLATYTGGNSYPLSDTNLAIGGVDFDLAPFFSNDPQSQVGVILAGNGGPTSITVDIQDIVLGSATTFYSLVNSAFGVNGQTIGNLSFNLASGATIQYDYIEGNNVRDHYNGFFNNIAPNVFGTAAFDSDRLDAQQIVIDSQFAGDIVNSITLNSTNGPGGFPFLAALTVTNATSAAPEPAGWAMMIGGFGIIGASMRVRRRTIRFA